MFHSKNTITMKTKNIIYTSFIIALAFMHTSCSDLLDVEPEDLIT